MSKLNLARLRSVKKALLPTLIFILLALIAMGPAITDCSTTMVGQPGDATAGGVWTGWQYQALDSGPWPARTSYLSAPQGERLWRPLSITQQGIYLPYWILAQVTSPVCGWNILVFSGFLATGLTMYCFVLWLLRTPWPAYLAGIAYAFSPFHTIKARDHVSYLHSELLVALLWACFVLWRRPRMRNVAITGVLLGALPYTDGYYILMGPILFVGFAVTSIIHGIASSSVTRDELLRKLRSYALAGVVALLMTVPIASIFLLQNNEIESDLRRDVGELEYYAGRPLHYLLPPREHPVYSKVFGKYQDEHLRANYSEETLSLGWTVMVLGLVSVAGAVKKPAVLSRQLREGMDGRHLIGVLAGLTILSLIFSAPPKLHFLGFGMRGPSAYIFEVVPFWRAFSRLFLLAHTALVPLAAIGVSVLLGRRSGFRLGSLFLIGLVVFDLLTFPPREDWSYQEAPNEYRWLARQKHITTVAEYPMLLPPENGAFTYLTWQVIHQKRLLNGGMPGGELQPLRSAAFGLEDDQTVPLLKRFGVQMVLFHPHLQTGAPESIPAGFELVRRFGETIVLSPKGSMAEVAVGPDKGFNTPEPVGWRSKHWMRESTATLRVSDFGRKDDRVAVSFFADSNGPARELTVTQGSKRLWQGRVESTEVRFEAEMGSPIRLRISPGPSQPIGDERFLGISLGELNAMVP